MKQIKIIWHNNLIKENKKTEQTWLKVYRILICKYKEIYFCHFKSKN